MTYPDPHGHGPDVPAGGTDTDGLVFSQSNHPSSGPGVNYGRPSQYDGPDVPTQGANVNPSVEGANTTTGGGVNPRGEAPHEGSGGPAGRGNAPYPDTSVG